MNYVILGYAFAYILIGVMVGVALELNYDFSFISVLNLDNYSYSNGGKIYFFSIFWILTVPSFLLASISYLSVKWVYKSLSKKLQDRENKRK